MPRLRLGFLKNIILSAAALIGAVSTLEVGLGIREIYRPKSESRNGLCPLGLSDSRLLEPAWTTHHRVKPLQTLEAAIPGGGSLTLRTNSHGLRGAEVSVPKPEGVYRILYLGDETVFAAEVDEAETFCARLQATLKAQTGRNVEVLNAGVPGFCPLLSVLQYRHHLAGLEADLVILNFDMSDVADDHLVRRNTLLQDSRPAACPHPQLVLPSRKNPLRGWERFRTVQWCRGQVEGWNEDEAPRDDTDDIDTLQGRFAWLRDQPPDWSVYIEQSLEPIVLLEDLTRHFHGRLMVATAPMPWQVASDASIGRGVREAAGVSPNAFQKSRRPFEILRLWCDQHHVPLVDTSVVFQSTEGGARLFLKHAPRFSKFGHELYAREVSQAVLKLAEATATPTPLPAGSEPWTTIPPAPTRRAVAPPVERRRY